MKVRKAEALNSASKEAKRSQNINRRLSILQEQGVGLQNTTNKATEKRRVKVEQ